ncbi:hypothetical protein [Lacrimispora indolis]|uniref:hypothetical protein n=1 Tax=Lacrimispora indolis TaxID=69825 RepID=UPI0004AF7A13|nr:hypothetical protein [Lacrimispora indolis]
MEALKWIVTVWNVFMVIFILWFSRGLIWKRDKAATVGFGVMAIMYILALPLIWR